MIDWRWALPALAALTAGCGLGGNGCGALSDAKAKAFATERLRDTFKAGRRHDMLGPYSADQLTAAQVNREDFGKDNPMNNITVVFHGPAGKHVINARIFPDCETEWRPQLPSEYEAAQGPAPAV